MIYRGSTDQHVQKILAISADILYLGTRPFEAIANVHFFTTLRSFEVRLTCN